MTERLGALGPATTTALAATLGALLTLGISLVALGPTDASHLLLPLAIGIILTAAVTHLSRGPLSRTSMRVRFSAIAAISTLIALVNLVVLSSLMLVSEKDALIIAALLAYSTAAAVGAGIATARESTDAVERLSDAAERIAGGDLTTRAESVGGGRELVALGARIDEMASRLESSLNRERLAESRRHDLIVAVSHDLRTPLAGLRALTEAIADGVVTDPATVRDYTAKMLASVESLSLLIDDLFEFVQLDAGAIEAESARAQLFEVVGVAVAACGAQAAEKRLALTTTLGDAAAASCSPRVSRVLQNLLQNAIRHTPPDGSVTVIAENGDGALRLTVSDDGPGVSPEDVERIFEPFWRGDDSRGSQGAGLGLALAKRIVEALGGRIEVSNARPRGARFEIVLPVTG